MTQILVVEDQRSLLRNLVRGLEEEGYDVTPAASIGEAKEAIVQNPDVVVLDLMLPDGNGIDLLQRLRGQGFRQPILVLTARDSVDNRVEGLDAGADDYLVKPFSFVELLARLEALGRRSETVAKETILRVGDLAIDLISRTASRRGKELLLLPKEFQLLEYLVRNQGQVVPRAMLLQHVWNLNFDPTTNIIDVYVGRVRRKVDNHHAYPLIHTVRGVGFCVRAHC